MSVIVEKGAVRSQIRGIENTPIISALYEIIDDRKHSNSNQVFIDIDLHNHNCMIGYSEEASKENIDNMVKWFNTNNEQTNINNIASKGIGLKFFEFRALGTWKHITKSVNQNMYYTSEINTYDIWNAEINDKISSSNFSDILYRSFNFVKEEEELPLSIENIFKNIDIKYPFKPKTIFRCNNLKNLKILDEYKQEGNFIFDDIIKRLQIKYYNEISQGFELYIKLPGYTEFKKIENDNIDVIGFTDNKNKELQIDIYIKPECYYGYIFKIGENKYQFIKSGNSILRQKLDDILLNPPDFSLFQYNINNMSKEDKKKSIFGSSEEACSGLYIQIGGTFISDQPVEWGITKRNLEGSKNFRGVLQCLSSESKHHLKLSGLKSEFNLASFKNLHNFIKCLTDVYKTFINHINKSNLSDDISLDSDDYILYKRAASKSSPDKSISDGYIYIVELGKCSEKHMNNNVNKFFKLGQSSNQQRIFDYITDEYITSNKLEFPDIDFYVNPHCRYISLRKINNIKLLEEKIKILVKESSICETYDCLTGNDIREYFNCSSFDELYNLIVIEINNHT
jgi:hypothetical protein